MLYTPVSISSSPTRRLLLVFSGWSTGPDFYADLRQEGWDVGVITGYDKPEFDPGPLREYSTIFILAWSLGVRAAETASLHGLDPARIAAAFAINGTPTPAMDGFGIPKDIYNGTERNLNPRNLAKFRRRMISGSESYAKLSLGTDAENDEIDRLRAELRLLGAENPELLPNASARLPWKRAYISVKDTIFPPDAQESAWRKWIPGIQTVSLDSGHIYPLKEIIEIITPNHEKIGRRFHRAIHTYDNYAGAQERIAATLANMLTDTASESIRDMIEIGPGTGILTRQIGRRIAPSSAHFIDLYEMDKFGIASREEYIVDDAENHLESCPDDSADLIASASVIQWFADPARFFANCARILRPGGILLCSTYLPGNLGELDSLRPSPLLYRTHGELSDVLSRLFEEVTTAEDEIKLSFNSPREALMHLRNTGVGGGTRAGAKVLLTALPPHPTLTYRPLFILARHPIKR